MNTHEHIQAVRRQQPIDELRRKAKKASRIKTKIYTQEDVDLYTVSAVLMSLKFR